MPIRDVSLRIGDREIPVRDFQMGTNFEEAGEGLSRAVRAAGILASEAARSFESVRASGHALDSLAYAMGVSRERSGPEIRGGNVPGYVRPLESDEELRRRIQNHLRDQEVFHIREPLGLPWLAPLGEIEQLKEVPIESCRSRWAMLDDDWMEDAA